LLRHQTHLPRGAPCLGGAALRRTPRGQQEEIHRPWREEDLQVRVHSLRKRAGVSSIPPIEADAPNVLRAIDFKFDSTIDDTAIKIASMFDEHTRVSPLNIVERSITADRLVAELKRIFTTAGGPPTVLRMDNGPEFISKRCNSSATEG
jgi:putative transposase